jgi:SpoVK/Ycf46/Vps4 family AAA+-type ATPase
MAFFLLNITLILYFNCSILMRTEKSIEELLELKAGSGDVFIADEMFTAPTSYLNCPKLYYSYFGEIPGSKEIKKIDCRKAIKWIDDNLKDEIIKRHAQEIYKRPKGVMRYKSVVFVLRGKIIIEASGERMFRVLYSGNQADRAQEIIQEVKKFTKKTSRQAHINLITQFPGGLDLRELKVKKPVVKLEQNYNDDLLPLNQEILAFLKKKDTGGLYLFHGAPGTGKSTYIRYLVNNVSKKKVIFLPAKIAGNLDSPELTNLLLDNTNSILIIEDAEDLIRTRDAGNNSAISMILNITDGLLGESLHIQVICTFNTHLSNIDKALLRKGRLRALYEFKELSAEKSKALLEVLGVTGHEVNEPMPLSDIYNIHDRNFTLTNGSPKVGFGTR